MRTALDEDGEVFDDNESFDEFVDTWAMWQAYQKDYVTRYLERASDRADVGARVCRRSRCHCCRRCHGCDLLKIADGSRRTPLPRLRDR